MACFHEIVDTVIVANLRNTVIIICNPIETSAPKIFLNKQAHFHSSQNTKFYAFPLYHMFRFRDLYRQNYTTLCNFEHNGMIPTVYGRFIGLIVLTWIVSTSSCVSLLLPLWLHHYFSYLDKKAGIYN